METVGSAHTGVALANLFTPVRLAMKNKDSSAILFVKKATKVWGEIVNRIVQKVSMTMACFATNLSLRTEKEVTSKKQLVKESIKKNANKMDYSFMRFAPKTTIQLAVVPAYRIAQVT